MAYKFLHPRYWSTWLGLGVLRILTHLPSSMRNQLAKLLAILAYHLAKHRRHITETNIRLAFPEMSPAEQSCLAKEVFYENILGLLDTGLVAWGNHQKLKAKTSITGKEYLQAAYNKGNGVVLVGAHYSCLDLGGLLFSFYFPVTILYRPHKNALFNQFLISARQKFCNKLLVRNDMRGILRSIKNSEIFWYPADQDYGRRHSVFAPFFNIQAATIHITSRLAKSNDAPVLVFSCHRTKNGEYALNISEPLDKIPSGNEVADATEINAVLEKEIRKYPAQYMWVHRRFKTRPEGEPSLYQT